MLSLLPSPRYTQPLREAAPKPDPREVSLADVPADVPDESFWGRDPFEVCAAIEEDQGYPLNCK